MNRAPVRNGSAVGGRISTLVWSQPMALGVGRSPPTSYVPFLLSPQASGEHAAASEAVRFLQPAVISFV